jgi:hypothetical protein
MQFEPETLLRLITFTVLTVVILGGVFLKRHLGKYLCITIPICVLLAVALPGFVGAKEAMQQNNCVANQKQMTGALTQWAEKQGKSAGERVALSEVAQLLKGGKILECPAGGSYLVSRVGKKVECSLPTHAYPKY